MSRAVELAQLLFKMQFSIGEQWHAWVSLWKPNWSTVPTSRSLWSVLGPFSRSWPIDRREFPTLMEASCHEYTTQPTLIISRLIWASSYDLWYRAQVAQPIWCHLFCWLNTQENIGKCTSYSHLWVIMEQGTLYIALSSCAAGFWWNLLEQDISVTGYSAEQLIKSLIQEYSPWNKKCTVSSIDDPIWKPTALCSTFLLVPKTQSVTDANLTCYFVCPLAVPQSIQSYI